MPTVSIPPIFRLFVSPYALLTLACLMRAGNWVAARAIRLDSGPKRSGMFLNPVPVLGSVLSVIVLGERPQGYHAGGFALVLGGLAVGNRRRT